MKKEAAGTVYLDKREALDFIGLCSRMKKPVFGIEVVSFQDETVVTSNNKSVWFQNQKGVYKAARTFLMRQMAGEWLWAEIKSG